MKVGSGLFWEGDPDPDPVEKISDPRERDTHSYNDNRKGNTFIKVKMKKETNSRTRYV